MKVAQNYADVLAFDQDQMVRGYRDGLNGISDMTCKDPGYWHGQHSADIDRGRVMVDARVSGIAREMLDVMRANIEKNGAAL